MIHDLSLRESLRTFTDICQSVTEINGIWGRCSAGHGCLAWYSDGLSSLHPLRNFSPLPVKSFYCVPCCREFTDICLCRRNIAKQLTICLSWTTLARISEWCSCILKSDTSNTALSLRSTCTRAWRAKSTFCLVRDDVPGCIRENKTMNSNESSSSSLPFE